MDTNDKASMALKDKGYAKLLVRVFNTIPEKNLQLVKDAKDDTHLRAELWAITMAALQELFEDGLIVLKHGPHKD